MTEKKSGAQSLIQAGLSVIKARMLTSLSQVTFYRKAQSWREKDHVVIDAIQAILAKSQQAGFWKCYYRLRFQGNPFNHKKVYRVYCRLRLNQKRRIKKVLLKREKRPLVTEKVPNVQWALYFIHDSLYCGKRFRTLNIIDEGTRECLAIEVDTSLPVERVIRGLERLKAERVLPKQLQVDKLSELISGNLLNYCENNQMDYVIFNRANHNKTDLSRALIAHFDVSF